MSKIIDDIRSQIIFGYRMNFETKITSLGKGNKKSQGRWKNRTDTILSTFPFPFARKININNWK